jgi:hypothetical protein
MKITLSYHERQDFTNVFWLFFGGSFFGVVLIAIGWQLHGLIDLLLSLFASLIVSFAFQHHRRQALITVAVFILVFVIGSAGQRAGEGLAILATVGVYGANHSSRIYVYTENYIVILIIWLLFGVPHRAFKYQLDLTGTGQAQRAFSRILVTAAAAFTGVYISMLHFSNGPLREVSIRALVPGLIFTVFWVAPAYRVIVKRCWQLGLRKFFSPAPLATGWTATLTELQVAFSLTAQRFLERKRSEDAPGKTSRAGQPPYSSTQGPKPPKDNLPTPRQDSNSNVNEALGPDSRPGGDRNLARRSSSKQHKKARSKNSSQRRAPDKRRRRRRR